MQEGQQHPAARRERHVWREDEPGFEDEEREAAQLSERLELLDHPQQIATVEDEPAHHTWSLSRRLLRTSLAKSELEPQAAAQLANLALRISVRLRESDDARRARDLGALALAAIGNARRVLGEHSGAADAFAAAATLRDRGTRDAWVEAKTLAYEALLRRDQRRLGEAVMLLDRVLAMFARPDWLRTAGFDDPNATIEALLVKAWCLYHLGHTEAAPVLLEQAEPLLDPGSPSLLTLCLRNGLVWSAIAARRFDEAALRLPTARQVAERLRHEPSRLLLLWAEARIDLALGERGPAEQALRTAAQGLARIRCGVDAALVWFDLALLYLEEGAGDHLRQLAHEPLAALGSPDIGRSEIAQLLRFLDACSTGKLTVELVEGLARGLESARRPSLAWWSAWGTVLTPEGMRDAAPLAAG